MAVYSVELDDDVIEMLREISAAEIRDPDNMIAYLIHRYHTSNTHHQKSGGKHRTVYEPSYNLTRSGDTLYMAAEYM